MDARRGIKALVPRSQGWTWPLGGVLPHRVESFETLVLPHMRVRRARAPPRLIHTWRDRREGPSARRTRGWACTAPCRGNEDFGPQEPEAFCGLKPGCTNV